MKKNQIDFITMGCSKNLVDSEVLMKQFEDNGYKCTHDGRNPQGEIVVINTCGFIADAKEESINIILEFARAKEKGKIRKLFVMGCLSQRYKKELEEEIPQVDKYYGKFDFKQLLSDLGKAETEAVDSGCQNPKSGMGRHLVTPRHYAYIKISEGCDRHCAYCAIPLMTGHHVSRPQDEILDEVRSLVASGVKEFQIVAQELTYYGIDIDGKQHIAELVSRMADIKGVKWIRLHYAFPTDFPFELLDVIREKPNVCKYLDIALQHISDKILHAMRRNITKEETYNLIRQIRERVPGIHIRTTLMVGYPNESEEDFEELLDFVEWARFERMGAFAYSEEEDTYSANNFEDNVDEQEKLKRLDRLMGLQQDISAEIAEGKVGKEFKVVIDRKEGEYYVGRTEYSSPEIDPEVLIPVVNKRLRTGSFYKVRITGAEEFDLYGEVI
ncbi:MAG: 30S ribosomal protein S12 methylthiotransferase RimO [Prevotella sp.]|nr:30S ribosomal protein S12 methylthiotransferase RimO [Prevotella sp.]